MKKKKLKLDLKKITIAKLSDKSAEKIKGGITGGCTGQSWSCSHPSLDTGATCTYFWSEVNGVYECRYES